MHAAQLSDHPLQQAPAAWHQSPYRTARAQHRGHQAIRDCIHSLVVSEETAEAACSLRTSGQWQRLPDQIDDQVCTKLSMS